MSANALAISRDVTLPSREDLLKAMQTSEHSSEAAQYLNQQVQKIVNTSKFLNKSPEAKKVAQQVVKAVEEFTQFVEYKFSQDSLIWSGKTPESSQFKKMQQGIAQEAIGTLSEKNHPNIRFDFAISKDGHFVRGYASTEKDAPPLEKDTVDSLDRLFNAWLANKHQIATEEGFFYKTDANGNQIRKLTAEEVGDLMYDSAQEFKDYLLESKVETQLVSRQREYPGEHRLEEAKKAAAQKAVDRITEKEEEAAPEVTVEPQGAAPSS